ncbi:TPR domain-containing glycosyltransferase [Thermanaeromonas sp. C210]|uniref:TPR domain-containing glycosyltransferase n=1 Tax=Thermanaeromonas sp. C210 TaxID=2731925 RepID=UPI001C259492|nr:TPR domain-containing glycosyltransferase [Thermanaeromonas sp. C210]
MNCSLVRCGRPWPTPEEELRTPKGAQKITLAMIVKDEEAFLAGCLEQALPFVDDIVLVDTGSQDRTAEVAASYGARLLRHEWNVDFAAARNAYLEEIREGWVLTLDADEYLTPAAGACLRRLAERGEPKVYYLRTYNYHNEFLAHFTDQANIRLFWRAPDARYVGEIHEQLVTSLPRELVGGPYVVHYGYLPGVMGKKQKRSRNLEILRQVTAERESPFDWYNYGLSLLGSGQAAEALEALEHYLKLETPGAVEKRPSAFWHAARAALACGKRELALEYAEKACEAPLPECHFTRGQVLEALGRVEEAIGAYRTAASLPDPPASLYQIFNQTDTSIKLWRARLAAASLLEKGKRYAEAEQEYKQVLEGDFANVFALMGLARVKRLQGKLREALKWARRGVDYLPDALEPHLEYLEVLLAQGELEAAREHVAGTRLAPALEGRLWLRLAGKAAEAGEWTVALEASQKVLENEPDSTAALVLKARALRGLGRLKEAEEALRNVSDLPDVRNERGCIALAQTRLDEAEEIFRTVLAEDPAHAAAATNLAQVLVLRGKVEEALEVLRPFVDGGSLDQNPRSALLAARCLNALGQFEEALALLSFLEPGSLPKSLQSEFYLVKGNSLFGLEDWERAGECYFEGFRMNPEDHELLMRVGLLMIKVERWEDAKNAFTRVLMLDPGNKEAAQFLELAQAAACIAKR